MPSEASSHHSVPPFTCRIPCSLLDKASEPEREFYIRTDAIDQKIDWLLNHSVEQAEAMAEVRTQTRETNGRVLQAEKHIRELRDEVGAQRAEAAPVVRAYGVGSRLARSKLALIGLAFILFVAYPWLVTLAPSPAAFVRAAIGVFLGG